MRDEATTINSTISSDEIRAVIAVLVPVKKERGLLL